MSKVLDAPTAIDLEIATIDGNEAAAYVAYRVNDVCSIYPITPSSTMAERSGCGWHRSWSTSGRFAYHDLYCISGPPPYDSQHVQDRG